MDISTAYAAAAPREVTFGARVTSNPWFFYGSRTHCMHESFLAQTAAGAVRVVDNLGIAPRVPVQPGDRIQVRGELVRTAHGAPIVHWTHHDPAMRHSDGFIRLRGRQYA